jgi:cell wall-associated NlpC family hydrolase/N-acetylmuramoyl-L-alanine amidase
VTGSSGGLAKPAIFGLLGLITLLIVAMLAAPMLLFAGGGLMFSTASSCSSGSTTTSQPAASTAASDSIPSDYLGLFKSIGAQFKVPWVILAGIGKVESDDGRTTLPGVHSGSNAFGAAGPMQIGIGGASTNTWGGAPVHPASEHVNGVATDANGDGTASVYDPADAIAGAARYLLEHGVLTNVAGAVFAYNHLNSYVQAVLGWANLYAKGGYQVSQATSGSATSCLPQVVVASSSYAAQAIDFARAQIGKPYLWGGTGPDAFDCSGLTMMAYRAAGIDVPRTADQQWLWGPRITPSQVQPGDLVFFAGADGTAKSPGHVGIVIGNDLMIDAPSAGLDVRIEPYAGSGVIGFTRPWAHSGVQPGSGGPTSTLLAGKVVGIDPGHNGLNYTDPAFLAHQVFNGRTMENCDTTGAQTPSGYSEAQFTFNVAMYLAADLRADGAQVVLTRSSNQGIGPCVNKRAEIINQAHADVAIDIHGDGGPVTGRGFTVLEPVADGPNNKVIASSVLFGSYVHQAFLAGTSLRPSDYYGHDGYIVRNDLAGLNLTAVPKVLIECGNLRDSADAAVLTSPVGQQRIAAALAAAIVRYLIGQWPPGTAG